MPVIDHSEYKARGIFRNPHVNTIYSALFRKVEGVHYHRQRLATPDGDFLDLDWSEVGSEHLLIALHGLEGSADRPYLKGMIRYFNRQGWDALGLNFRSCSGEMNRALRSYHMGETTDLDFLVRWVAEQGKYSRIALVGFSLGGNVILKYLGEQGGQVSELLRAAVAFSVPCHIASANSEIDRWHNRLYLYRFLSSLNTKMKEKARRYPEAVSMAHPMPKTFSVFDDRYTAPLHGFEGAQHYWESSSSLYYLPGIRVPALLVNAADDTFLSERCYPQELAAAHRCLHLEIPRWGGHVGFYSRNNGMAIWSEKRAFNFISRY